MRAFLFLAGGLAAYVGALFLSNSILAQGVSSPILRALVALSPMIPGVFICGAVLFTIRTLDELQRKLQYEALALSFAGTALLTFGYGFLEGVGFPKISMFAVWPLMAALWVVGVVIGRFRFG
ncbi:hypothetical protein [Vannielia litorea]|uniref:hypothetical protein n=1 Tax=Vannielia litorea TaxID=1217970 RepID=UPI001C95BECF|nr:hypothetical protein [Vannielia litorea]MBY6046715.1 hypothetical protein [Vannielia litorea]MBY6074129.1 hypothetical protein [Vannielia litorea]